VANKLKILVGLGNPGDQYQNTRHNAGYMALAVLAKTRKFSDPQRHGRNLITKGRIEGQNIILAWPLTYMNNSGQAVKDVLNYYNENISNLLVIHDDMDIQLGRLKGSTGGGSGGHNGLISIMETVSGDFDRLRVGIGRPSTEDFSGSYASYVLANFPEDEGVIIDQALILAAQSMALWTYKGMVACQRKANVRPKEDKKASETSEFGRDADQEAGQEVDQEAD
jgi:PTH1 family peptidyl-tRNA hydrolase